MAFYIGIEDLAASALIAILSENDNNRFVSYEKIEEYGKLVVKKLRKDNEPAVVIFSRESTNAMYRNYSDFFEEKNEKNHDGISLKSDKSIDDLIDRFCGYISLDVLLALSDEECLSVIKKSA